MFLYEVGDPSQGLESWREGTVLFLNPRAKHPVPRGWLGASVEQYVEGDQIVSEMVEPFHPYGSTTVTCDRSPREKFARDSALEQAGFEPSVPARTAVACPPISLDSSSTKTTSGVRASRARFGQLADERIALRYR
jgi:hypothetical protein